jgi:transposase InsO family protein
MASKSKNLQFSPDSKNNEEKMTPLTPLEMKNQLVWAEKALADAEKAFKDVEKAKGIIASQTGAMPKQLYDNFQMKIDNKYEFPPPVNNSTPMKTASSVPPQPFQENFHQLSEAAWNYMATCEKYNGVPDWKIFRQQFLFKMSLFPDNSEDVQKKILLSIVSAKLFERIKNFMGVEPGNCTFNQIDAALSSLCNEQIQVWIEMRKFKRAALEEGESVDSYYDRLQALSANCEFFNKDEHIRDQLICGMSNAIFDKVLSMPRNVSSKDALLKCRTEEFILKNKSSHSRDNVNAVRKKSVFSRLGAPTSQNRGNHGEATCNEARRNGKRPRKDCFRCGGLNHKAIECYYHDAKCFSCGKLGHIAPMCTQKEKKVQMEVKKIDQKEPDKVSDNLPIFLDVRLGNKKLKMELDSGAPYMILKFSTYKKYFGSHKLEKSSIFLTAFTNTDCGVVGEFVIDVTFREKTRQMSIVVVNHGVGNLLGRSFMNAFNLKLCMVGNVKHVIQETDVSRAAEIILNEYPDVVCDKLGKSTADPITLETKKTLKPIFLKAREVPYAFRDKVEQMIKKMISDEILEKVEYCNYGTPLVVVPKKNGELRICGDYKSTINQYLEDFNHPLPTPDQVMNTLNGCKYFFVVDLNSAYLQLPLSEESSLLCAWSTHLGVFKLKRMPFGIKPATTIFQREMEKRLAGIAGVIPYVDDIYGGGRTIDEAQSRLRQVLDVLKNGGYTIRRDKCKIFVRKLKILGFIIDENGISKSEDKIKAIQNVESPKDIKEVQAFCGLVNYYSQFLPKLADILNPLYALTEKDAEFKWSDDCEKAFSKIKQMISDDISLANFDVNDKIVLVTDASDTSASAVIGAERGTNNTKPIQYYSKKFTKSQKNYSVVDKEALAIVLAFKKFKKYLLGKHFKLYTDQKALLRIFDPNQGIPVTASARLTRWAIFLSGFDYEIIHVRSKFNIADPLSRLRQYESSVEPLTMQKYERVNAIRENGIPMNYEDVLNETKNDSQLCFVKKCIENQNWNSLKNDKYIHFFRRYEELSVEGEIIMWNGRLVVPYNLRKYILAELHSGHLGINKMKSRARQHFWWPYMDDDITVVTNACDDCRMQRSAPEKTPLTPWPRTDGPWQRIHSDYFGPIWGYHFMVTSDSHSKWLEVFRGNTPTSEFTVQCLRQQFARFGIPDSHVSDNGSAFTGVNTKKFLKANGVYQVLTAPYNPASNGLAENAVKTVKRALIKKLGKVPRSKEEIDKALQNFLLEYRNTPHVATGISPAQALMGRSLKDNLTHMLPKKATLALKENAKFRANVERQKKNFKGNRVVKFNVGEEVYIRCYKNPNKPSWVKAKIEEKISEKTYRCRLPSGRERKVHVDQMQSPAVKTPLVKQNHKMPIKGSNTTTDESYVEHYKTNRRAVKTNKHKQSTIVQSTCPLEAELGRENLSDQNLVSTKQDDESSQFYDCIGNSHNTDSTTVLAHEDTSAPNIILESRSLSSSIVQQSPIDDRPIAVRRQRRNIKPPERFNV